MFEFAEWSIDILFYPIYIQLWVQLFRLYDIVWILDTRLSFYEMFYIL